MEKEINLAIILGIPIVLISLLTYSFDNFLIYFLVSYFSLFVSSFFISKLYKINLNISLNVQLIVFSIVITLVLGLLNVYAPVFILPLFSFEPLKILKSIKYTHEEEFYIYLNFISLSLLIFSIFSYLGLRYLGLGAYISFLISSLPVSSNLIGPKLVFGKPVGFLLLLSYLIISGIFILVFPLISIGLSLIVFIYVISVFYRKKSKNVRA